MKITSVGSAHPYWGGWAFNMQIMALTFQPRVKQVSITTFTLKHHSLFFQDQSQTVFKTP